MKITDGKKTIDVAPGVYEHLNKNVWKPAAEAPKEVKDAIETPATEPSKEVKRGRKPKAK